MANIVWCNIAIFLLVSLFLANYVVVLEALRHLPDKIKNQPYRTGYHFQPPKNWMNGISSYPEPILIPAHFIFLSLYFVYTIILFTHFFFVYVVGALFQCDKILTVSYHFSYNQIYLIYWLSTCNRL